MKIKIVKRKFYNKWNYKISFYIEGSSFSRFIRSDYRDRIDPCYFQISNRLSNLSKDQYAKRVERNTTDLYFNDKSLFDEFYTSFKDNVQNAFMINPELENFSSINNAIISKKYPHDRYKFKVFLQPHRIKDYKEKKDFLNWLDTQNSAIYITTTVKNWFLKTDWNWDRRYMYVENEQTLLMLRLRKADAIGTVYNYVLTDK